MAIRSRLAVRPRHVCAILLCATVLLATHVPPVAAQTSPDVVIYDGEQIACDPSRACHPVRLELNRVTGSFKVIKGPAISCIGSAPPQPGEIRFQVICDTPQSSSVTVQVTVREWPNGSLNFRMRKVVMTNGGSYQQVIHVLLQQSPG